MTDYPGEIATAYSHEVIAIGWWPGDAENPAAAPDTGRR